ncbi:MAG: hypothetical protein K2X74_01045 [Acetobacteraceae bacterium]|nr:hypothetical protein [Acetobacteraceae bacterium]
MDGSFPGEPIATRDALIELCLVVARMNVALAEADVALTATVALCGAAANGDRAAAIEAANGVKVALERMAGTRERSWQDLMGLLEQMGGTLD